ncbi:N-acetylmuramoyl-L-alanine amidase [uncultured Bacteroides sp.]|uniref:N-acetylmuramoyl-L-alanine amidase family protein n=1 Tax=uncultured Bacteroides sp. TaxID=162156 RepID=UPI002AA7794C|nr:N-acetylmuramoyl-L-alanine amidase [uncultured Bacteroides sp.]
MKQQRKYILLLIICLWLPLPPLFISVWSKDFVVVIDPGHGGHDPGAIGQISKEKNINLNVALKLGSLIRANDNDVKVIFTRSTDVFIPLDRRAEIANDAKADLFISIHTNSVAGSRIARGASTWTLGLAKSEANLAVAKRENSVILYESDYKTRYAGFNPNSAESYIIFEFMQDKYMSQSVHLASLIQKEFRHSCKRVDRGVHQAGFLVLKASAMPSILVELGFISTPEEEQYLNSEEGTFSLANAIYRAFLTYKREHEIRMTGTSRTVLSDIEDKEDKSDNSLRSNIDSTSKLVPDEIASQNKMENSGNNLVFKIQILTSSVLLSQNDKRLKGLHGVENYREGGLYKYTYGASSDYNKVLKTRKTIAADFKDAFIIAFENGEKININAAIDKFKRKR